MSTPMLDPTDPLSMALWKQKAHAQSDGINSLPRTAPDTSTLSGMDPYKLLAMFFPKGLEANELARQAAAAQAPAASADQTAAQDAAGAMTPELFARLMQQQFGSGGVSNLGMGNILSGGGSGR